METVKHISLPVKLEYEGPKRKTPLGVNFAVGSNVPDEEFVGVNTHN